MTRIQFDFSSIDPRWRALMIGGVVVIVLAVVALIFIRPRNNEVAEATITPTLSPTPSQAVTPTVAGPPTETLPPSLTPTLAPYEHPVQSGETLIAIIQFYGYRDLAIIPAIIALNGMSSENDLTAGETLLIPRQTPTVGPTFTITPTLDPLVSPTATNTPGPTRDPNATVGADECTPENRCQSSDGQYWIHIVREGENVALIALLYDSYLPKLKADNGLVGENPVISVGQEIKVPIMITQVPTMTPTGGPDSTATPLPTPMAPSLLAPANNSSIARGQGVMLQWAAARPLAPNQSYVVILTNTASGAETRLITRTNSIAAPESLQPGGGQSIRYEWRVVIVNGSSTESPIISGTGQVYSFTWGT
jgi:hypothetical protein